MKYFESYENLVVLLLSVCVVIVAISLIVYTYFHLNKSSYNNTTSIWMMITFLGKLTN